MHNLVFACLFVFTPTLKTVERDELQLCYLFFLHYLDPEFYLKKWKSDGALMKWKEIGIQMQNWWNVSKKKLFWLLIILFRRKCVMKGKLEEKVKNA